MTRPYLKGDRVRLTPEEAAKVEPYLRQRHSQRGEVGTVLKDQGEDGRVTVQWDGLARGPLNYDAAVLERVE